MNWLKRLLRLEEPEPVEKPEPKPPVLEPCPICGRTPKPEYVCDTTITRYCCRDSMIKVEGGGVGASAIWKLGIEKEPASMFLVVYEEDFDYATRPAPKKPRIEEPVSPGEYWARIRMGSETVWG